jgi:hypothetical protein
MNITHYFVLGDLIILQHCVQLYPFRTKKNCFQIITICTLLYLLHVYIVLEPDKSFHF